MLSLEKYVVLINPDKCVGCRSCEIACAIEHSKTRDIYRAVREEPRPVPRIRVVYVWSSGLPAPVNCRHCEDAPCIQVCPTRALYRDDYGNVLVDHEKCILCLECSIACPFGVPEIDLASRVLVKCDMCLERVRRGELPACVEACPTGALVYGTIDDVMRVKREEFFNIYYSARKELSIPPMFYLTLPTHPESPLHRLSRKSRSTTWFMR